MQNPSNAYGTCSSRQEISSSLYIARGPADASRRCDTNSKLGDFDLVSALLEASGLIPGQTVIDAGCGSGQHLARFAEAVGKAGKAMGFDVSPGAVEKARERGLCAEVADLASLPVQTASADCLVCCYAVYYHDDLLAVIAEWERVLKPGGILLVAGPAADSNKELYDYHRAATGLGPSDIDLLALGFVERQVFEQVQHRSFADVEVIDHVNRVKFPSEAEFLSYWRSTSLYQRSRERMAESDFAPTPVQPLPFTITKTVSILSARRT